MNEKSKKRDFNIAEFVSGIFDRFKIEFKKILPQLIAISIALLLGALVLQANNAVRAPQDGWLMFLLKMAPVYMTATVRVWAKRLFLWEKKQ